MIHIALKMLFGDRAKYIMLVSGLTFASLLITQQSSIFCGIMRWTTSTIRNTQVPIWVVDPKVEQANETKALRETDLDRVRSVAGVKWAVPLFQQIMQARMLDGSFKTLLLMGLDTNTLIGAPTRITKGRLQDIFQNNAVIIDEVGVKLLSYGRKRVLDVGDVLDINDKEARIVAICKSERSFMNTPYVFTTYDRALEYAPPQRKMLSFVLAAPAPGKTAAQVARIIERETQLKAYTEEEFFWATIWWYVRNTGIPIAIGTTVILGVVVGMAISGQTFYSFVLENLRHLGALKAMGVTNLQLAKMLLIQSLSVGMIGFGCGVGLASVFGQMVLRRGEPPFFLPYQVLIGTFCLVIFICCFAALLGIRKVTELEPAMVFRA